MKVIDLAFTDPGSGPGMTGSLLRDDGILFTFLPTSTEPRRVSKHRHCSAHTVPSTGSGSGMTAVTFYRSWIGVRDDRFLLRDDVFFCCGIASVWFGEGFFFHFLDEQYWVMEAVKAQTLLCTHRPFDRLREWMSLGRRFLLVPDDEFLLWDGSFFCSG